MQVLIVLEKERLNLLALYEINLKSNEEFV